MMRNAAGRVAGQQGKAGEWIDRFVHDGTYAAAVAVEQEMKARVQEMQAKVDEAQAQVPLAMAEAFRSGRLGVMDYYNLQNVQADTRMRNTLADGSSKSGPGPGEPQ